jgi:protocatechuate 3,4-dioxygenase beta subunit
MAHRRLNEKTLELNLGRAALIFGRCLMRLRHPRILLPTLCLYGSVMWISVLAASVYGQSGTSAATLSGRITVIDDRIVAPVRRAHVTLTSLTGNTRYTFTDADGQYSFGAVLPGRFTLEVIKPGFYVAANESGDTERAVTAIEIKEGTKVIKDITVERGSAIEGRVFFPNGEPAKNAVVQVRLPSEAKARLMKSIQPARSDDRGFYRLHSLPPGDYIVEADVLSRRTADAVRGITSGAPTYYPGVSDVQVAVAVAVPSRSVAGGVDFTLVAQPMPSRTPTETTRAETQPPPGATSRIAGRVRDTQNSAIAGAVVTVTRWDPPFNVGTARASTDEQGRYEITVAPGMYQVRAAADGFVTRSFGWVREMPKGRPIELLGNERFDRADVILPRHGAVEGRIVDEFGDPAPGVSVQLATVEFRAGFTRLLPEAVSQPTDDRGVYRMFDVTPDEYYVMAVSGPFAGETTVAGLALTLYPGTRTGSDAKTVRVRPGTDTVGIEFAALSASMSDVRGSVVTPDGTPVSNASVALMPMSSGDVRIMLTRALTRTDADGAFLFRNVPEGPYAIQATSSGRSSGGTPAAPMFGYSTVDVSRSAPIVVRVDARPPSRLTGRVVFEGKSVDRANTSVQIRTVPVDFVSAPFEMRVQTPQWTDGNTAFALEGLVGRQVILATVRPDDWVLSQILVKGTDITDVAIDFGRGDVTDAEIIFRPTAGTVSGRVRDKDGMAPDYLVILYAADPSKWTWPSRFIMLGRPNQNGEYKITGIPPGNYRAVALSGVPDGMWWSAEFLRTLISRSVSVDVQRGQSRSVALELVR